MGDLNSARLLLCDEPAREPFRKALGRAISYGADAYIERDPWRTYSQQSEKVRLGFSQVQNSAHCHMTADGKPASRAVHLISRAHFYFALMPELLPAFAVRVGAAALKEGLRWGGLYGPKVAAEAARHKERWDEISTGLRLACWDERWDDAERAFRDGRDLGACWDPMHIEWRPT